MITSADPVTGEIITVTSTSGHMAWQPSAAVVYVGQLSRTGPAADVACKALNFFTSRRSARSWARSHLDYTGKAIDQADAAAGARPRRASDVATARPEASCRIRDSNS